MPTDPLAAYDQVFEDAGREWNVDPMLLKAMMMQESQGNARAVSPAGALGLMQIMPDTARKLGLTNPFDPAQSIFGAAKYMNEALETEGSPEGALLYYHGGPGWRQAYGPESRAYVPKIAGHYRTLQATRPSQPTPAPQAATAQPGGNPDINRGTGLVDPLGTLQPPDAGTGGGGLGPGPRYQAGAPQAR